MAFQLYTLALADNPAPRYVGQTTLGLQRRLNHHKHRAEAGSMLPVHCWMRKHGVENVTIVEIASLDSAEALDAMEIQLISILRMSANNLLNVLDGGVGTRGYRHTDESKAKISASTKGRPKSAKTRRRMSEARKGAGATWYGKSLPDSAKAKLSALNKGENNAFFGRTHTPEAREKIKQALAKNPSPRNHIYWHERRGLISQNCSWCTSAQGVDVDQPPA